MAEIKSALEIALDRTKNVEGDKKALEADKYKRQGKMLLSKFLNDPDFSLKETIKKFDKKQIVWIKEGSIHALMANLVLPQNHDDLKKNKRLKEAFLLLIKNKDYINRMFSQLDNFYEQYIQERENVKKMLEQQYAPRLKEKEEELSKKFGSKVKINASSDPEFADLLHKTMLQLEGRYKSILSNVKKEFIAMFSSDE